ncbi:hemolysin family protein [Flaviflagellibacter deserti]|uniref:Hemolysin family protein n=1 Tax=Flaviflagellibacter deserti TaxID=2267266 RepID=A0ABV9Z7U3_9HYPH
MSTSNEDPSQRTSHVAPHGADGPGLVDWLKGLLRGRPASLRDEIEDALSSDDGSEAFDFSPEERAMLKNILGLRDLGVGDVMVHRSDIIAVPCDMTLSDTLLRFEEAEHSRLPVYGDTIDDLRGMIHIKDVLRYLTTRGKTDSGLDLGAADLSQTIEAADLVREVLYVPPSMPANALLAKMQATHIHMALVIDEYGGTDGLATIEDLIEIVVGDIEDEHDETEAAMIQRARDGSLIADGRATIDDLVAQIGPDFDLGDLGDDVDTVGGLIVTLADRVPERSEIIAGPSGFDFEVLDADPRRVKRVRIRPTPSSVLEGRSQAATLEEDASGRPVLPTPDAGTDAA